MLEEFFEIGDRVDVTFSNNILVTGLSIAAIPSDGSSAWVFRKPTGQYIVAKDYVRIDSVNVPDVTERPRQPFSIR